MNQKAFDAVSTPGDLRTLNLARLHLQEVTRREVLSDDGRGRRQLLVGHRSHSKFLFINVSFDTLLHVWEDDSERTIRFANARYAGAWCELRSTCDERVWRGAVPLPTAVVSARNGRILFPDDCQRLPTWLIWAVRVCSSTHELAVCALLVKPTCKGFPDTMVQTPMQPGCREGFMKRFDGMWRVQPFTQQSVDAMRRAPGASGIAAAHSAALGGRLGSAAAGGGWLSPAAALGSLQRQLGRSKRGERSEAAATTLVSLEQALLPKAHIPSGIQGVVRGLCAKTLHGLMDDVRKEAARRRKAAAAAQSGECPCASQCANATAGCKGARA